MQTLINGTYKFEDKPSQFSGLWKNEKRNLNELRKGAWKLKKRF